MQIPQCYWFAAYIRIYLYKVALASMQVGDHEVEYHSALLVGGVRVYVEGREEGGVSSMHTIWDCGAWMHE